MKKHILLRTIIIIVLVFSISIMYSCGPDEPLPKDGPALVIIAGVHSNSQKIKVDISDTIEEVYSNFGNVRVIVSDKTPSLERKQDGNELGFCSDSFINESLKAKNKNEQFWRKNFLNIQVSSLNDEMDKLTTNDPEVDTLRALHEAKVTFNVIANGETKSKDIIIYDTGLCTVGDLSFLDEDLNKLLFSNNINKSDVESVVNKLDTKGLIPNLTGIRVTWYGLGSVAGAQPELSKATIANLQMIWGEILKKADATPSSHENSEYDYFIHLPTTFEEYSGEFVTPVINWFYGEEILLTEEKLGFKPNSAELISEEETTNVLTPYAQNLINYPNLQVLLVGTTADPNKNGGSITLSEERANAVKTILCKLGVNENNIKVIGWGAKAPLYDETEWQNGSFIEEIAKKNRAVWILPYDSDTAKEILNIQNSEIQGDV